MDKILKQPYVPIPATYRSPLSMIIKMTLEKNPDTRASIDDILCVPEILELVPSPRTYV